jgi:hypothetical protein
MQFLSLASKKVLFACCCRKWPDICWLAWMSTQIIRKQYFSIFLPKNERHR